MRYSDHENPTDEKSNAGSDQSPKVLLFEHILRLLALYLHEQHRIQALLDWQQVREVA